MKVLIAHNYYQQYGGEDGTFERESAMLSAAGFDVRQFSVRNDHIRGFMGKATAATCVVSNRAPVAALRAAVASFAPDIVHIHNFFPTLSPAAIDAVARQNIPVVLTLHNFRLICVDALLMRDGRICEDCVGKHRLPGVLHGCYRGSRIGSAFVAWMGSYFGALLKRYPHALNLIAVTEFAKSRLVRAGFPAGSIAVRGNFMSDPGAGPDDREQRIVYVGRLSLEKGVDTLVRAARGLGAVVEIIGEGPERTRLEAAAPGNVVFCGQLSGPQVLERIRSATALALPSRWYEGFPLVSLEAMATATPILASAIGSLVEIVTHHETGCLVAPEDPAAWHDAMTQVLEFPSYARTLGVRARARYLEMHSDRRAVTSLTDIYEHAQQRLRDDLNRRRQEGGSNAG